MDLEEDKDEIITQVLNYGTWEDLKLFFKLYSEKDIKKRSDILEEEFDLGKFSIFGLPFSISGLKKMFSKKLYLDRSQKIESTLFS